MENNKIERAFDIKGLFKVIFKNIKFLIIIVVVGAIAGIGVSFSTNNVYITQNTALSGNQATLNAAKENLSTQRIKEVESTYTSYVSLTKQKTYLQKFIKNSIYLNLDETSAKSNTVVYSISGNTNVTAIISAYKSLIKNNALFSEIKKIDGLNVDSAYLSELINIKSNDSDSTQVVIDNSNNRGFTLVIYGRNDTQCKELTKCVKNEIDKNTKKFKNSFGNYTLRNSGDTYEPVVSTDISKSRMDYDDKLSSVNQAITNSIYNLSEDQKTYFNALIDTNAGIPSNEKIKTRLNLTGIIKNSMASIIVLFIVYFVFMVIKYISGNKIHTQNEFTKTFNLDIITNIKSSSTIDFNVAVEEIAYLSKKLNGKKIGLLSSLQDNDLEVKIYNQLKNLGVKCEIVSSSPSTKDEFASLLDIENVVLFETLNCSNFHDVEKMLRYYELKEINVVGTVLIS